MNRADEATAKACCADLYQSDLARLILGDTLHPGGLGLTNRLGRLMNLQADDWVVDLASGRGTSAMALSRVFHCRVVGVEFGAQAVREAQDAALESPVPPRAFFLRGDAELPPLQSASVDAVICECSMSIFSDKPEAVRQVTNALRPGGRFGLSDVTVEPGWLPKELGGDVGRLLCLSDALNAKGYASLLADAGLTLLHQEDASLELLKLVEGLEGKLGDFVAAQNLSLISPTLYHSWLQEAPAIINKVKHLMSGGQLGYWLFVAEKPH